MTVVVAADPGLTVGWASVALGEHWDPTQVNAGQLPHHQFEDWIATIIGQIDLLLYETFTITPETSRKSPQPEPIEVIGVLKHYARRSGVRIEGQAPGAAKNFVSNTALRKIGLWVPGQDHARDGIRHLVLGIVSYGAGQAREELLQSLA